MNVNLLGMYGTDLVHYSSEPEKAILFLLQYDSTLIMEPGELADFALGHKLLVNSLAKIIILTKDDYYLARERDYFHIFMPVNITEQTVHTGAGYWKKTTPVRKLSTSYLTAYK